MAKKFVPDPELLNTILTRYKETGTYAQISRETGLSTTVVKRIIEEAAATAHPILSATTEKETTQSQKVAAKPRTASQILNDRKKYIYTGPAPLETKLPTKAVFYGQIVELVQEYINV